MTTNAVKFQGSVLNATETASTNVTAIGEVIGLDGPGGQAAIIDATHSTSTAKEKLMGLPDEGSLTVNLNYLENDAGQELLKDRRAAQTADGYTIVPPSPVTTKWVFDALVLGFSRSGAVDGKWTARAVLELTGPLTEA